MGLHHLGHEKHHALIPAFVGAPLVLAGLVGMVERFLKHAMHLAAMIGLLGCLGAAYMFVSRLFKELDLNDKKHSTKWSAPAA